MINLETGLSYGRISRGYGRRSTWYGAYWYCFARGDYDAADLIQRLNEIASLEEIKQPELLARSAREEAA